MKKAFTLVELLVVVVVLVTLMTITFRLVAVGGDSEARNLTMDRLHRLENALSGYYAAFGTYPPVNLHGYRNPFLAVNDHGVQNMEGEENRNIWGWLNSEGNGVSDSRSEADAWRQVQAACLSQPVACNFPFSEEYADIVRISSDYWREVIEKDVEELDEGVKNILIKGFDNGVSQNIGRFSRFRDKFLWTEVQLFRFGLMSYLLPRYLVMMNSDESFYRDYEQWKHNNALPNDPLTGRSFASWENMRENYIRSDRKSDIAHVANIASQAACSRWMANFEGSLFCTRPLSFYGVDVGDKNTYANLLSALQDSSVVMSMIYSPGGYADSGSNLYLLDGITMRDGWGRDFYYYSPPPYQSYTVWSSGPNGRTFPPWVDRSALQGDANRCIGYWVRDDIVNISH